MSRDNVTPFRKRRPPPREARQGPPLSTHRGKAVAVQFLALMVGAMELWMLAGIFLAVPILPLTVMSLLSLAVALAGFFIALSNRNTAMPWAATHHEFALRSIAIGFCASMLGAALGFVAFLGLVGLGLRLVGSAWVVVRSVYGAVRALTRLPMHNPFGWGF